MKLPNKVTSYNDSILSKLPTILERLSESDEPPYTLYNEMKGHFSSVSEYIDVLDCLFALNIIEIDSERGVIHYAV